MSNSNLRRRLLVAAAGGMIGYIVLIIALVIYLAVGLIASDFPMGGGVPSSGQNLILFGFVPVLIMFGSAIPAWALGANWWHGILAGIVAMAWFVLMDARIDALLKFFSLFSVYELIITVLLVTVFVSVMAGRAKRDKVWLGQIILAFASALALAGFIFFRLEFEHLPDRDLFSRAEVMILTLAQAVLILLLILVTSKNNFSAEKIGVVLAFAIALALVVLSLVQLKGPELQSGPSTEVIDYWVFMPSETIAFINAVLTSVMIAIVVRNKFQVRGFIVALTLVVAMLELRLVWPEEDHMVISLVVSLLPWILLPVVAAFFATFQEKDETNEILV